MRAASLVNVLIAYCVPDYHGNKTMLSTHIQAEKGVPQMTLETTYSSKHGGSDGAHCSNLRLMQIPLLWLLT